MRLGRRDDVVVMDVDGAAGGQAGVVRRPSWRG
jgi:hypothetical protein